MSDKVNIKELYNEPDCMYANKKNKKSPCEKPIPGSAGSGCAFEGAYSALLPFDECVHIVHAPLTCLGASWQDKQQSPTSYKQRAFCTDITLNDVIFGGEKKLYDSLDDIFAHYNPKGIFIYETCVSALIGEDIDMIAKIKEEKFGIPVIPIHAAGFVGMSNFGIRIAGITLLERLIGTKEPEKTTMYDINLLGEYDAFGSLRFYQPLLEKIGVRILSSFSSDGEFDKIRTAHRAKFNLLVSSRALITMARKMKELWSIPYAEASFFGKRNTSDALRTIAQGFNDGVLARRVEQVIREEETKLKKTLSQIADIYTNKRVIINVDGEKVWSLIAMLSDIGISVVASSIDKNTEDDVEKANSFLRGNTFFMVEPTTDQEHFFQTHSIDLYISERKNAATALKHKIAFIDVDIVLKQNYIGYEGLVNFAHYLVQTLQSPVFSIITKQAPWKNDIRIK